MKRYTFEEFVQKIAKADKINDAGKTAIDNKTRAGKYINLQTGLSSHTFFVGQDLKVNKTIIEVVG